MMITCIVKIYVDIARYSLFEYFDHRMEKLVSKLSKNGCLLKYRLRKIKSKF